jgi:EAL domain-containing protein (putative c-di-GMP-specific phosphodiesterase class I)
VLADLVDLSDDAGLSAIDEVAPDVVQLDVSKPGRSPDAMAPEVRAWIDAARSHGAELMALGVDSSHARAAAVALGCTTARGLLLGAPGALAG